MDTMPEGRELCLVVLENQTKEGLRFEYHFIQRGALQLCGRSKPLSALDLEQTLKELSELRDQGQRQEQGKLHERPFETLERLADELFGVIAPIDGLATLLQRVQGAESRLVPHVTLAVSGALARRVPWEMWRLECLQCSGCGLHYASRAQLSAADGCLACKQPLRDERVALFDCAELAHVPVGEMLSAGAARHRDKFVIVVGALTAAELEAFMPHIATVDERARALFGEDAVVISERTHASVKNIKSLLREPDVRGLYYFGHADDRGLKLYGDQYLTVEAVMQAQPAIPFVFLNACYAAAHDLSETKLALAFAGAGKLVVAPTTEVMAAHAAEFAESFFLALQTQRCPPSECLSYAYRSRLKHGVSPVAGVYRRFGRMSVPLTAAPTPARGVFSRPVKGVLDPERFSFDIAAVLGHAQQVSGEARIDARQLVAGLLRKGQLTRYLVRGVVVDPDRLLGEVPALRGPGARVEKPARFGRENLGESVQQVLQEAHQAAALRGEDRVSERDVLARLLRAPELVAARFWPRDVSRADFLACLRDTQQVPSLDGDGALFLEDLSPVAERVVRGVMAQVERLQESKRALEVDEDAIWLWSFLAEPGSCIHEYCRACGIEPNIVLGFLRNEFALPAEDAAAAQADRPMQSLTAVSQAIVPILRSARAEAHRQVSEHHLLAVYCRRASGKLKVMLEREAELVLNDFSCKCLGPKSTLSDLPDELRPCLSVCTNRARAVLLRFWSLALELNSCSNRVLLAAFLDQDDETATAELSSKAPHATRKALSEYLSERSRLPEVDAQLHRRALTDMIKRLVDGARKRGSQEVHAGSLLDEFMSQCPRSFRDALRELPRQEWRQSLASIA